MKKLILSKLSIITACIVLLFSSILVVKADGVSYDLKICMVLDNDGNLIMAGNDCVWGSNSECYVNMCYGYGGYPVIGG